MRDTQIHALFALKKQGGGSSTVKYTASYWCIKDNEPFFSRVFIPLFSDSFHFTHVASDSEIRQMDKLVNIVIHSPKDLLTGFAKEHDSVNDLAQDLLSTPKQSRGFSGNDKKIAPIIHISLLDCFRDSLYGETPAPVSLPRSYPIIDSSIWNRLVFINRNIADFKKEFVQAVDYVYQNYEKELYDLEISYEYADLNARMLREAFLRGGHAKGVSPFVYHSERRIDAAADELLQEIKGYGEDLHWRFLLLDDKVDTGKGDDDYLSRWNQGKSSKTKTDILLDRISEIGFSCKAFSAPQEDPKCQIELIYVDTIDGALELMRKHQFDIILLDYLLKDDYGFRLLREVEKDDQIKGPNGELFFMFISAFTTAVSERLTFEGLSRNKRNKWQIGEGACPTNTPALFKFRLLQLMCSRLRQTCISDLSYVSILENLVYIFSPKVSADGKDELTQRIQSVRGKAYEKYRDILGSYYDYFSLREDEDKSLLVKSFMRGKDHLDALFEHLLQLIHLVAFGTVRQWPEIWEEYQFVVRTLNIPAADQRTSVVENVSRLIEKYIIDLRSA